MRIIYYKHVMCVYVYVYVYVYVHKDVFVKCFCIKKFS